MEVSGTMRILVVDDDENLRRLVAAYLESEGYEVRDDYLVKPFSPKVLVARVKAVLRRSGAEGEDGAGGVLSRGAVSIDPKAREVLVEGREIELTSTEFELLRVLAEHPGWVYSREELLEAVWGYSYLGDSRLVDVHIANLRKKIGDDPSDPQFIRTVRGVGYKFQPPRTDAQTQSMR
jgi:two-component system alkaline phosphatase synthesis response regulator PhoP